MDGTARSRASTPPSSADGTASFSSTSAGVNRWDRLRPTIVIAFGRSVGGFGSRMDEGPAPAGTGPPVCHGAICRSGLSGADALLDPVAQVPVDIAPVLEGALQHRLGDAAPQVADDVADQPVARGVVEHLADHR